MLVPKFVIACVVALSLALTWVGRYQASWYDFLLNEVGSKNRVLLEKSSLLSSQQCRNPGSQQLKAACMNQMNSREEYRPDNSTIFKIYKHVKDPDIKYFHEAKGDAHRDRRYPKLGKDGQLPGGKGKSVAASRQDNLKELFRQWAQFAEERNLVYWIAHGLLIGWYWNNDLLPWDYDLDVQVTAHDLLGVYSKHHNTMFKERYLFDVNPHKINRLHQYDNVIDARFIDTYTGFYVDITGLAYNPKKNKLQCKSPHSYEVNSIFPLRSSIFIGQKVWVPNKVEPILAKEYKESCMTRSSFMASRRDVFQFNEKTKKWEKK